MIQLQLFAAVFCLKRTHCPACASLQHEAIRKGAAVVASELQETSVLLAVEKVPAKGTIPDECKQGDTAAKHKFVLK